MRLLVKIGGAELEEPAARAALARSVADAVEIGHEVVLVHGGGNQIRALGRRLGLEERYHRGLRVTDEATAEAVLMVLGGLVNRRLVLALERAGLRAVGLTGADGALAHAVRHTPGGVDLGWVGEVARVDRALVDCLLASGFVPVIATVMPALVAPAVPDARQYGAEEPFFNVNADMAAGPLARELGAEALLFLTDVPGVLDGDGRLLASLDPARAAELVASGVVSGGMLPKVGAALAALEAHPRARIAIAPASAPAGGPSAVLAALDSRTGTRLVRTPPS